jgi:uncharacterized protein YjiS (DUF1127 family)
MPAIIALAASAALAAGRSLACAIRRLAHRIRNRRAAFQLSRLDDRMLADIGLTRSDLRDAYAEPLWHDPTDVLAQRAAERRLSRRPAARSPQPSQRQAQSWCSPRLDRQARYLM